MRTIKLVVIGSSGVGKTSLRYQYISSRFTTGYRATIGADFITRTLPHHNDPAQNIILQIWDTAGQERFSSLSSAFFRGADAALLMFDVNDRKTLDALTKWWAEFKDRAPLSDEDVSEFCCVVVGNKMDLVQEDSNPISELEALKFIDTLVPPEESQLSPSEDSSDTLNPASALPSPCIDINGNDYRRGRRGSCQASLMPRSKSLLPVGTVSSTRTGLTVYHTPSSSIFENYESARSSPLPPSRSPSPSLSTASSGSRAVRRKPSSSSSNSSTPTITPSLFARTHHLNSLPSISQQQQEPVTPTSPLILERRPKLFFTSAKTGNGVSDVFEHVAQRVITRLEYQENIEARTLHMQEDSTSIINLGQHSGNGGRQGGLKSKLGASASCC